MKRTIGLLWIAVCLLRVPVFSSPPLSGSFSVKDYGASGDGKTSDTRAINKAIGAAALAGGGTVYFAAGDYVSGSIQLKSHITLYLEHGARIIAVAEHPETNYDQAEPSVNTTFQDFGHSHWHNALIWGDSLHDVAILGQGEIYGKGLVKDWEKDGKTADKAISLYRCRNVIIRDIAISHGGWFAILTTGVDNLTIDNLRVDTNRDGIDIDCCRNVVVSNCMINSPYDDGLCLKSTFALGFARPTENVTITNCQLSGYDEGTLLNGTYIRSANPSYGVHPTGRIKFGTESNGGFKNVAITNCVFSYCRGLALETVDGGFLEDIVISNITMRDVVNDPIFLRLGARMRAPAGTPIGALRRISISNVRAYNVDPLCSCTISGLPGHDITDISLSDIHISFKGEGTKEQAERVVPENEAAYPEPGMFGVEPAYGLYVRHAADVRFHDVQFELLGSDQRPSMVFDDVKGIELRNIVARKSGAVGTIVLKNVSDFSIHQCAGIPDQTITSASSKVLSNILKEGE
jgi:polygalacturonase